MFKIKDLSLLLAVALLSCVPLSVPAQTQLVAVNEIKLPVPASLGNFGRSFPILGDSANEKSSMKVLRDQSLVVLDPDASGKWPLVRVTKWWTKAPVSEVLNVAGWTAADTEYGGVEVDLQITPDGHYAVVFAAASWDGPLFHRKDYVARKPDTLITVIDLQRWQIIGSAHTANTDDADFRGARILNGNWIALQGMDKRPESVKYEHLYDRRNRLISIPDLKMGPGCVSKRPGDHLPEPGTPASVRRKTAETLARQNDEACADVLRVSGVASVKTLESVIYKGHGLEPKVLMLHSLDIKDEAELDGDKTPFPINLDEQEQFAYYDHWNSFRQNEYRGDLPEESTSHLWYQLYGFHRDNSYQFGIGVFDAGGQKLVEQVPQHLLCKGEGDQWKYCRCSIEDISEEQHALLTSCEGYSIGFLDVEIPHKQWLSVFRTDNLSEVGATAISKNRRTSEAIAVAEGRAYVLAVELGETLRVYGVPGRSESQSLPLASQTQYRNPSD
jgi:hypothetical protein